MAIVGIAVAAALVWVLFATLWLWRNQERVVYQPSVIDVRAPEGTTRVEFRAADGQPLYAYLITPRAGRSDAVVLAFHGNADLAAWLVPWARELADRAGVSVFLPEYRGYGGIPGTPTYVTAASDAIGALTYVRDSMRPETLVLFGHSLGSAVASDVAAYLAGRDERPAVLVLQSPFTSARAMAARMLVPPVPWLWRRISRVHYSTVTIVAELECPVWVAHGTRDVVVPVRMGRQVFAAARRRGELLIVDGAGHNDVADVGGERYWSWLTRAMATAATPADAPLSARP